MSNKVRCQKCRGQKQYAGIGGIMKDCEPCNKTGLVDKEASADILALAAKATNEIVGSVANKNQDEPKTETITAAQAFQEMGIPAEVIAEAAAQPKPILAGYDDELMKAILAEPTLDPLKWQQTYAHVKGLFGLDITGKPAELINKVQRAQIRETYAYSQPRAERKVDVAAGQNVAANTDPEYVNYLQQENKRLAAQANTKTPNKPNQKKSSMGGV